MLNIIQNPVTLRNSWPGYYDRVAICDHIQDGNMAGSWARFNNPNEEVSAHFGISKTGRVEQWVSMDRSAWANGIFEAGWDSSIPWLAECQQKKIAINTRTISIEHEGHPAEVMPEAQYKASLELHQYIIKTWPTITPDRKHIIGHYQISPKSRANCPGPNFPFTRLMLDLQKGVAMSVAGRVPGNFMVRPEFESFWFQHGGLGIFGYPISAGTSVIQGTYGKAVYIQYFERARFELQIDGSVMLGLVGSELLKYKGGSIQ